MTPLRVLLLEAVPRRCVKCGHTYPTGEFQATSARCGVLVWKTWCRECLNTHYRDYERRTGDGLLRRQREVSVRVDAGTDPAGAPAAGSRG